MDGGAADPAWECERMSDARPDLSPASGTPADGRGDKVGDRLREAREAAGLTLDEVGARTRIPLRHLEAIEATNFAALPSPTYAVGFARAYARAVGVNDVAVAHDVRRELAGVQRPPEYVPFETADPARVPPRGVAIVALGLALAVLILAGLWFGTDLLRGGGQATAVAEAPAVQSAPAPTAPPSPAAPRQVTLTAGEQEVWLRVYDANNTTLYIGTLAAGTTFDVPANADRPKINVGRPDQLRVAVDGRPVPPLGDGSRALADVPVDAASIAARLSSPSGSQAAPQTSAVSTVPSNPSQ